MFVCVWFVCTRERTKEEEGTMKRKRKIGSDQIRLKRKEWRLEIWKGN